MTTTRSRHVEADLQELLADAHGRVRELEAQVERLTEALLTISLKTGDAQPHLTPIEAETVNAVECPLAQLDAEQTVAEV